MDFEEVLAKRKSVRRFLPKKVPDALISRIIGAAVKAPTNCNTQLWNFIIVKDKKIVQSLIKEAASNTLIGRAPLLIVPTYDNAISFEGIQSVMLAIQNMLLEATNLGLGSICINSIGSPTKIREILEIPKTEQICSFVLLGYAAEIDEKAPPTPRRELREVIHYNKFNREKKHVFSHNPDLWALGQISSYQRFYCRKTFLGKEMDIMGKEEKEIVAKTLTAENGPFLDLFSYDGSYLSLFPSGQKIVSVELTDQTSLYARHAAQITCPQILKYFKQELYKPEFKNKFTNKFKTITLVYKAERLPTEELKTIIKKSPGFLEKDGKLIIISRTAFSLYGLAYSAIRLLFDDDVRKTGMYAFFGPYKPVSAWKLQKMLGDAGYKTAKKRFFLIPPVLDMIYQMYLQFIKSEGTSFLHRLRRENFISYAIKKFIRFQGFMRFIFGSVVVIEGTKK